MTQTHFFLCRNSFHTILASYASKPHTLNYLEVIVKPPIHLSQVQTPPHPVTEILIPPIIEDEKLGSIYYISSSLGSSSYDNPSLLAQKLSSSTYTLQWKFQEYIRTVFNWDEYILEPLINPNYLGDDMHHRSFLLFTSNHIVKPMLSQSQTLFPLGKFIGPKIWYIHMMPSRKEIWWKLNLLCKVDICITHVVIENILLGLSCSPEEVMIAYKALFQEFCNILAGSYTKISGLDPAIIEHCIKTCPDATSVQQKQIPTHPAKALSIQFELTNYIKASSSTPLRILIGYLTLYPSTKNRALFMFALHFWGLEQRLHQRLHQE